MSLSLQDLAARIGATIENHSNGAVNITGCAPIDSAGPTELTFLANPKYTRHLDTTQAAAVLIDAQAPCPPHLTRLISQNPYLAYRNALIELYGYRKPPAVMDAPSPSTISPRAAIHESASIAPTAHIHPFVTIESGASIGANTVLYPGVYVGVNARIGDDCVLHPNVSIYEQCIVGDRVILHSSVVIGQDGFGYVTHEGAHHKIPQTGIVVIEDDVEIGAGCAIERAAMGETRIGQGTKFADLISIGHGTTVGKHCLFVSLAGVAGSVTVGDYVVLGGKVGVSGHITIGDGVQAMAHSGIAQDVPAGQKIGGAPAIPYNEAKRNMLAANKLHVLVKRVRTLESEMEKLRQEKND